MNEITKIRDLKTSKEYNLGGSKLKLFASSDGWHIVDDLAWCPINKPLEENKLYLVEMSFIVRGETIEEGTPQKYLFLLRTYNKNSDEDGYTWIDDCSTTELMPTTYNEDIWYQKFEKISISFVLRDDWDDFPDRINIGLNTQDGEYLQDYYAWVSCNIYEVGGFKNE